MGHGACCYCQKCKELHDECTCGKLMSITITEQEYKELMRIKRANEVLREKISARIGQLREGRKDSRLSESEKLTMAIFIDMLQELLA